MSMLLTGVGPVIGGAFSPLDLDPVLWLKADEGVVTDGAAQFTAANSEYLSIADNASLSTGDVDFWIAGWVRFDSVPSGGAYKPVVAKWSATASDAEYAIYIKDDSGTVKFAGEAGNGTTATEVVASTFGAVSTGTWYFVVLYHDAVNNLLKISVNGGAYDSIAHAGGVLDGTNIFKLGADQSGFHDGRLDSWGFGKSPVGGIAALASTISSALYNSGAGLVYDDLTGAQKTAWGLVSFWNLDEVSGTRYDAHGTNHLADNNTVTLSPGIAAGNALTDGLPGKAAQFTAANSEYLSIADNASLSTGDIDFWFGVWAYLDSKGALRGIASKGVGSFASEWDLLYNDSLDRFAFSCFQSPATQAVAAANVLGSPSTETWYFLMVYHDSVNDEIGISVNGGNWTTAVLVGGPNDSTLAFLLGAGSASMFHDGRLDSSGFGKSPIGGIAGIKDAIRDSLYNSGRGKSYSALTTAEKTDWGLVSFWNLEEPSGTREDSHGTNDLTDNNTVTQATGIAEILGDGNLVSLVTDFSGEDNDATQATVSNRIALRTGIQNGLSVLRGDGSDDVLMASLNGTAYTGVTMAAVIRPRAEETTAGILAWQNTALSGDPWILFQRDNANVRIYVNANYQWTIAHANDVAKTYVVTGDGTTWKLRVNGVSQADHTGALTTNQANATGVYLGSGYNDYSGTDICEILAKDEAISAPEAEQLETYWADKWGVS